MKRFYLAPTAAVVELVAARQAVLQSTTLPDDPATSLVIVSEWRDHDAEDAWDAVSGVEEMPYYAWNQPPPERLATAADAASAASAAARGVMILDAPIVESSPATIADAMKALRSVWPGARP